MAQSTALEYGRARRRAVRLNGPWAWALAGLLVVLTAVALDPGVYRPLPGESDMEIIAHKDWRGNSARVPLAR